MFDIGFSELLVIGVVALLVIGPERMPKVARTAGHLFGRFQRYASSVKADIDREMNLEDLRKAGQEFRQSVEDAAHGVEKTAAEAEFSMRDEVKNTTEKVSEALADLEQHDPNLAPEMQKLRENMHDDSGGEQRAGPESPAQGELALSGPAPETGSDQLEPAAKKQQEQS